MKFILTSLVVLVFGTVAWSRSAFSMGQKAQIFEKSSEAGIWDGSEEFYLRMDLSDLVDLKDQKFVWAGFHKTETGQFSGEVVADDFGQNERRFPARASLLTSTPKSRFFLIEVLGAHGEILKEIVLKAPPSTAPER